MKIETILNAMIGAKWRIDDLSPHREWQESKQKKRQRQYRAFRARILRIDAEKGEEIEGYQEEIHFLEIRLANAVFELKGKAADD